MRLIIFGPQASGKGTQAAMLAQEFGAAHISLGEKLRQEVRDGTPTGKKVKAYLDKGDLVPAALTNRIIGRYIREHPSFILDGYPRTKEQAAFLDTITQIDKVIVLRVKDNTSISRVLGRVVCPDGHDYHIQFKPPLKKGVCDVDGLPLKPRSDDSKPALLHRLQLYHIETEPLLAHYKDRIVEIDGEKGISDVQQEILRKLRGSKTTQRKGAR